MAVNDLMMKIQLLVESGKSSAELNRLQQALKALQTQLTALDRTQLAPLTRDLAAVKQAAAQLKTVNLGNFATQIDAVKKSFTGLGLATTTLDQLRAAYQKLNTQLASGDLSRYQAQLKSVGDRLREAKALTLTNQNQARNTTYEQLNRDLGRYNSAIITATQSIVAQQQAILGLKNQLAALPKIKIDPTATATIRELRQWANASGRGIRIQEVQKSFASMQAFNTELAKQQGLYNQSRLNAQNYQQTLAKLRVEAQRLAIPDLTVGGTRNLVRELDQAKTRIADLRTKELVPLQNLIRTIQAKSNFSKVFNVDPIKASVKVARAELAQLSLDAQKVRAQGGAVDPASTARMAALKQQIVDSNKQIADLELKAQQTSARNLAVQKQRLAAKQNELALGKADYQNIQAMIASQKQAAQIASQSVKSRPGGIVDTSAAKAAAQAEANLYKNNITALKQYLNERKAAATEEANLTKQQIQSAQQRLAQQQLTKAQWAAERAEIQANIAAEKARSQVYQQTLRDLQRSVKEAIQSEKERERSLRTQIKSLTQLGTAQAQVKAIQLQSDLTSAKTRQGDLRTQVRDIEQAAKAEIQRIRAVEQSTNALRRQASEVTTLARLFKSASGPVDQFFAAFRFMLGPQMAGFAAAGSVLALAAGFVEANKSVENLIRGLNAISGGQGVTEFERLATTANKLGVSIQEASHSFLQLKAAAEGTGLEGEKINKVFTSFSNALNVTGADSITMNRAFRSISQMISKGQLYAEELKGQLAEALPGAIQVFARALDVTPKKLMALVKSGAIEGRNLERVLALVAKELDKTYKIANEQDFTFVQKANLAKNALVELFVAVGNTGVWKSFSNALLSVRDLLQSLEQGVPGVADTLKAEWGLIASLYGDGVQQLSDALNSLVPEVDFSTLKAELFALPATIKNAVLGALGEIGSVVIDAEQIIKNFHERQKSQPGVQISIELLTDVNGLIQKASDVVRQANAGLKDTGLEFTPTDQQSWWERIFDPLGGKKIIQKAVVDAYNAAKEVFNAPIEIKADITPVSKEAFSQDLVLKSLYSRDYDKYLRSIEEGNQKIREGNALAQQQNVIIEQNNRQAEIKKQVLKETVRDQQRTTEELLKQANSERVITAELRKQNEIDKRNRGARNDVLDQVDTAGQEKALTISKERVKAEKEILDIQQAYQDALLSLNEKKYNRWAESGQITKAGAEFLIQSSKVDALRQAWTQAQTYVEAYNTELDKGDKANLEQLKLLKQQADDQLKFADGKAKEVGDEYKLKQIMEARLGLAKSISNESLDKLLTEAELKLTGKEAAQRTIDEVRQYAAQEPAILTILTQPPAEPAYQLRNQTIPVTFELANNTASQILSDWQTTLQGLSPLTCPIEVDGTNLKSSVSDALSDVTFLNIEDFGTYEERLASIGGTFRYVSMDAYNAGKSIQTVGQQARTTVAELQKINQLPPGTYTIKAANPAEQQSIEEKVKLLQQNKNLVVNVQWVTTGGETVDGFTSGIEKKAVVTITAKADPAQAAAEGAKVGQAAATAANQAAAQNPLKLTTESGNYDLFSGFDGSKLNQGIQLAMDQAKSTVKTSVAQMNQELLQKLGTQGVQVKIETVVDQTSFEGWQRQVQRLSAQDNRVPLRADTAELDQEFRRIDGQFAEWNRTAGNGLSAGFVSASQQAQNFGTLVDQVNQKMRAIQNPQALPTIKPVVEPVVTPKSVYDQVQDQLNQQNPITISADAAPMIGEIQKELDALRASGATNIKVMVDEKTGKLVVTADTVPATNSVKELIASINANPAVQTVNVVFNVPELSLPDKTQVVNVVYRDSGSSSRGGQKNRWGGYISGYGGGDRVRALLEPGEFVLRKEAVKALGLSQLIKLNHLGFNAKIPKPSARWVDQLPIPRFAGGGMVTGQPIVINVPGSPSIQVQGSRDSAMALANLLTRVGRAV